MALTERQSEAVARARQVAPVGMLLVKLGLDAKRQFSEALKPTELTPRHVVALFELAQGPMTQQALGDAVGVDPSKLVGLLNDLEAENLVLRRRDRADRRRHIVEISEQGQARLAAAKRAVAAVDERLLEGLDEEQRSELQSLLTHVAGNACPEDCAEISRGELDVPGADCV